VAMSGREVAVKGPKSHKCGRRKFFKHKKFKNTESAENHSWALLNQNLTVLNVKR
jgi:hypothetical protein